MNIAKRRNKNTRSTIATLLLGLAYAAVFSGVAMGPALAADQHRAPKHYAQSHHDDRRWHDDRHWHDDHRWHGGGYYYAPPPAIYVPPPAYYSPYYSSPGISIVVPLRIH